MVSLPMHNKSDQTPPFRAAKPRHIRFSSTRRKSYDGFTLLEVMVALAILATAFAAVLKLHSDSIEMVIASRVNTKGAALAQYKMTEIEIVGLDKLPFMSGEFGEMAPDYVWDVEVEPTQLNPWVKVTVKVRNRNMKGAGFNLTEYMRPGPIQAIEIK